MTSDEGLSSSTAPIPSQIEPESQSAQPSPTALSRIHFFPAPQSQSDLLINYEINRFRNNCSAGIGSFDHSLKIDKMTMPKRAKQIIDQFGTAGKSTLSGPKLSIGSRKMLGDRLVEGKFMKEAVEGQLYNSSGLIGCLCDRNQPRQDICKPLTLFRGAFHRRMATKDEEITKFSKAFICTNEKTGRTEIMTTRRQGAAHLDLDLNTFDTYASHTGHRILGRPHMDPRGKAYDNLTTSVIPDAEPPSRPNKGRMSKPTDKVEFFNGHVSTREEIREHDALGFVRRKLDTRWSRSNVSMISF